MKKMKWILKKKQIFLVTKNKPQMDFKLNKKILNYKTLINNLLLKKNNKKIYKKSYKKLINSYKNNK